MNDIQCARCGESWNSYFLRSQTITLFPLGQIAKIRAINDLGADLMRRTGRIDSTGAAYPWAVHREPVTAALQYWWQSKALAGDEKSAAAATLVHNAIHLAVRRGRGCPKCRFIPNV
ncbi:hypothetical protein M8C13_32520 [Crossiella sp. SN42]|uniref:hypothetical protein n=1 Tax=Crossiella sp. SN42 TaxID=2944808 RepID=UPI00207D423E|nr:hypothetical protein [Crossiella sp. SN42]MCO1580489.1 hypothetical protein [Crossiella sp. SN42]